MIAVRRDAAGVAHIVAMSGGKDSTAMAFKIREMWPDLPTTYVCTPTGDELPEMVQHWVKLGTRLGHPIIPINERSLKRICIEEKALPNNRMRFCTRRLKVEPWLAFLAKVKPCVSYVGLRADEEDREGIRLRGADLTVTAAASLVEQRYPLREIGWGIGDVWRYLEEQDAVPPERTDCARCFYQTLGEWWRLWREHPDVFADAEGDEVAFGHTYRSPSRDTWPAALKDLRIEFERGKVPLRAREMDLFRGSTCRICTL